ncbi:hypothetical protein HY625_00985 [Candidatus Uhrbacteria bacterium]|nr:hypothetical protein [Candidatus Uhrbacteria bacterium]
MVNIRLRKITRTYGIAIAFFLTALPRLSAAEGIAIQDPLQLGGNPFVLYGRLVKGFVGVSGAVALFFFIQGGFWWLASGGNDERIKKGKDTLIWATLGLAVIFGSYFMLSFIISLLTKATGVPPV